MKYYFNTFIKAGKLFHEKRGTTLASSSTFYALITIVPSLLLLIRGIGFFLGSLTQTQKYIFIIGSRFFPEVSSQLLIKIQDMIKGPLFAGNRFTLLNFIILGVSSITFLNSIYSGLYFITNDKKSLSLAKIFRGIVIIGITMLTIGAVVILPHVIIWVIKFFQNNFITAFLYDSIDILRPLIKWVRLIDVRKTYWLKSNLLHGTIFLIYFTLLYRWLFAWEIKWREAFFASLTFVSSIILGKYFFWIYVYFVRDGMMRQYGDFYTSLIGVMWLYFLMIFFFYAACVCQVFKREAQT